MLKPVRFNTILFDVGGVLVDWNPRYLYRKLFKGDEDKVTWFLNHICTGEWNDRHDMGITFSENAKELVKKFPEYQLEIEAYGERYPEMFSGPIEETVKLLHELKSKGYPIYCISNWSGEKWAWAKRQFPFLDEFDGVIVSGLVGLKKPDVKIYELLLKTFPIIPQKTIYIDDIVGNIEVARKLGFETIHFRSASDTKEKLATLQMI